MGQNPVEAEPASTFRSYDETPFVADAAAWALLGFRGPAPRAAWRASFDVTTPAPSPARPTRTLAPAERHALDELVSLGAALKPDFTETDLKHAYRQLALRHHPDRHHGQSSVHAAHDARIFALVTSHYRCLLALVDRRN